MMNFLRSAIQIPVLAVSLFAAQPQMTLKGTMINSDGDPEAGVMVVLTFTNESPDLLSGDTVMTGSDGTYQKAIPCSDTIKAGDWVYVYMKYQKTGFIKTYEFGVVTAEDVIDLGVRQLADANFVNVSFKATIVDSSTNTGIGNAKLFCHTESSNYTANGAMWTYSPEDTLVAGPDGAIAGTIRSLQDGFTLFYVAEQSDYITKEGYTPVSFTGITIDPIAMKGKNTNVRFSAPPVYRAGRDHQSQMAVFSVNGACLYKGNGIPLTQLKKIGITGSKPLIIEYSGDNTSKTRSMRLIMP